MLGMGAPSFAHRLDTSVYYARDRSGSKPLTSDSQFSWTPSIIISPAPTSQAEDGASDQPQHQSSFDGANYVGSSIPSPPNIFGVSSGGVATNAIFGVNNQPPLVGLGRLQRHMARVPRPQSISIPPDHNLKPADDSCIEQLTINGNTYSFFAGGNTFWAATVRLLLAHSDKQQELEVEFEGEEGTGLGPTMEFYALLSAELRRHSHGLWVSEDRADEVMSLNYVHDLEEAIPALDSKAELMDRVENRNEEFNQKVCTDGNYVESCGIEGENDFYVNPETGLFPAPWPQDELPPGAELRFYVLGIAVAKCLLDQRQMDLPFSTAFLYLLCQFNASAIPNSNTGEVKNAWPADVLDLNHFTTIYPERGKFLRTLISYVRERNAISSQAKREEIESADLDIQKRLFSAELGALCISMTFAPATRKFGQTEFPLTRAYDSIQTEVCDETSSSEEFLTADNAEAFIRRSLEFALHKGIRKQMCAFRAGFERVLPLDSLAMFTPSELGRLISGESCPEWTHHELWKNCEPAAGYTRQSRGFRMLIESLSGFDVTERRAFLRFVTGCPTLPPGGLQNLHPKLKVARKDGTTCGPFPSVNTCMHYLKLPEYRSASELKKYLLAAASQRGFFLN